jgi:hypothetical protein
VAEIVAIATLALLAAGLLTALVYREREHDKGREAERTAFAKERAELLTAAIAPQAIHMAQMQSAMPHDDTPPTDVYDEELPGSPGLLIDDMMMEVR